MEIKLEIQEEDKRIELNEKQKLELEYRHKRLMYYADDVRYQFRPVGAGLAAIGIVVTFLETIRLPREVFPGRRGSSVILGAMFLVYSVTFHSLSNLPLSENMPYEVHRRFWIFTDVLNVLKITT